MRLVAFSDLHLDAPFANGGRELASVRRAELRRTVERIARLASELEADALLCAGDLYEHDRFTPDTVELLERVFRDVAPVPVLISPGNHDWYGPTSLYRAASWSENVYVFESAAFTPWDGIDGIRIWGFAHQQPAGTGNPLERFEVSGEALHLGLFHGSENSDWTWACRNDERKQSHAPFTVEQIQASGLAHCVVGHYHEPVEGDWHTYCGAPAALSFGESGRGGAYELEFDERGQLTKRERHRVSRLEVHGDLRVDISGCDDLGAVEQKLAEVLAPQSGIGRVTLEGELSPTVDLDLGVLEQQKGPLQHLSVRLGQIRPVYDFDEIASEASVRGEFLKAVRDDEELDGETKRRVLLTGLRALDGRADLEVV